MDTWHERTSPLDQVLPTGLWRGKEGIANREKRRDFKERVSTFSLEFPVIGLSVLIETRGEVGQRCKGYAWVPVLWSFEKFGREGFSPTCFILWLRAILMDRDILRPGWPCFRFQRIWTE